MSLIPVRQYAGFTLVEVMVTLVIVSVAMLAISSFFFSSIGRESIAQQKITAVHMAEQLIEVWQDSNAIPTLDCEVGGSVPPLVLGVTTEDCVPTNGIPIAFDILITDTYAQAPIPQGHLLHSSNANIAAAAPEMGGLLMDPTDATSVRIGVRAVRISWDYKSINRFVLLTHITRPEW